MGSLRDSGHLRGRRSPAWNAIGMGALAAASLLVGVLLGRTSRDSSSGLPRYLLLLYEDGTYRADAPMATIIAEYAGWADSLRRAGELEAGEKLGDQALVLGPEPAADASLPSDFPTGFFIVRAPDLERARRIAASSPHVQRGGRIALRPIEESSR